MTLSDKSYYRRLCRNILADRFNWRKYCTPSLYFGREICVTPLHCSYGQIGYTINFPYTNAPEVEYDWEMNKLTIGDEIGNWYVRRNQTKRQNSVVWRGWVFNTHVFQQLVRQKLFRQEVPGLYQIHSLRRNGVQARRNHALPQWYTGKDR